MELTAFTSRLGESQGRIRPAKVVPRNDEHLVVLGDEAAGHRYALAAGDHVELRQHTDVTGVDFIRAHVRWSVPESLPADFAWRVSLMVDGTAFATAGCRAGHNRELKELTAHVSKLAGPRQIALRLELVKV